MNNHFIIPVGSRNNAQWVESNINSILSQDYTDYTVFYFDDASEDDTVAKVNAMVGDDKRFIVWSVESQRVYKTWFFCKIHNLMPLYGNEILVFLDGDDMFASENVLSYINAVYNQTNCWMTYGGMRVWNGGENIVEPYPQNSEIPPEVIKQKAYRKDTWRTSHLKTMRTFLWQRFDRNDLRPDGKYMVGPDDLAIMFGMLEMCPPEKVYRVTDPLYIYNHTEANQHSRAFTDSKNATVDYEKIVRSRTPYDTITTVTPTLAGGLGNQMFEIAAAASLAKDNNSMVTINPDGHILPNQGRNINNYLDNVFARIPVDRNPIIQNTYTWEPPVYKEIPFSPYVKLVGHFQSWKYFDHNRQYIQELFSPKVEKFEDFGQYSGWTGIHVRRGDYYKFPDHHPQLLPKYYEDAYKIIKSRKSNPKIVVFSDDPEWCRANLSFVNDSTEFADGEDYKQMYKLSWCSDLVLSNSSFGWWAAYLHEGFDNRTVYAPSVWFGRAMIADGFKIDELVMPSWTKIMV